MYRLAANAVLKNVVSSNPRDPGVVAMATDRRRNLYEGAYGQRRLDRADDTMPDTVFAIFSTTKAITGTAALQLVEEGKLDLDAPAKTSRRATAAHVRARHHRAHAAVAHRGLRR